MLKCNMCIHVFELSSPPSLLGDELDAKIRKAEKEVQALETTLIQLVTANGNYGAKYKKVDSVTAVTERAVLRYVGCEEGLDIFKGEVLCVLLFPLTYYIFAIYPQPSEKSLTRPMTSSSLRDKRKPL